MLFPGFLLLSAALWSASEAFLVSLVPSPFRRPVFTPSARLFAGLLDCDKLETPRGTEKEEQKEMAVPRRQPPRWKSRKSSDPRGDAARSSSGRRANGDVIQSWPPSPPRRFEGARVGGGQRRESGKGQGWGGERDQDVGRGHERRERDGRGGWQREGGGERRERFHRHGDSERNGRLHRGGDKDGQRGWQRGRGDRDGRDRDGQGGWQRGRGDGDGRDRDGQGGWQRGRGDRHGRDRDGQGSWQRGRGDREGGDRDGRGGWQRGRGDREGGDRDGRGGWQRGRGDREGGDRDGRGGWQRERGDREERPRWQEGRGEANRFRQRKTRDGDGHWEKFGDSSESRGGRERSSFGESREDFGDDVKDPGGDVDLEKGGAAAPDVVYEGPTEGELEGLRACLGLTDLQAWQMSSFSDMIAEWNKKVNLISRKNIDKLWENHILPSAALAGLLLEKAGEGRGDDDETESEIPTCVSECLDGAEFIDVGTGGGFPGIPLAICFPRARFVLVDSVGKKIDVVKDVVNRLGLENVETVQTRAEGLEGKFDFVVGRSVSSLSDFCEWTFKNMRLPSDYRQGEGDGGDADEGPGGRLKTGFLREENLRWQRWGSVRPGLLYINGGDHREQTDGLGVPPEGIFPLSDTLPNVYLGDKYVLHYTAKQLWLSPKCRKRRSEARKREWLLEEKRKRKGESSLQLNRKSISARLDRAHAARRREAFTTQWRW